MKIPGVFFAVILTILSSGNAAFTDMGIPPNLQGCFMRMSQTSNSYRIFSPASRQRYCLKQYLNKRNREDWLLEPSLIPDTNEFKEPNLTPFETQFNDRTPFWSPSIQRWQFPTGTDFWQPKTRFWPVVQPSLNKEWPAKQLPFYKELKPTTKAPKILTNSFIHTQKPESTTPVPIYATRQEVLRTITKAPLDWRQKKSFNTVPSNLSQRPKFWRAPMWSVAPNSIKILGRRFNNQWRYPDWSLDYPWNGFYTGYNIPEYPYTAMNWIPE